MDNNPVNEEDPQANPQEVVLEKGKKVLIIVLIGLFVLFFIILIAFLLRKVAIDQARKKELEKQAQYKTNQPTAGQTANKVTAAPALNLSFQQILSESCENTNENGVTYYGIDVNLLPIIIKTELLEKLVYIPKTSSTFCIGNEDNSRYTNLTFKEEKGSGANRRIYIYDKNSKEDGHGGPPFLGLYGLTGKTSENLKINAYLSINEGPTSIKEIGLILRGQKTIYLNKNEEIYLNFEETGIPAGDSQLTTMLDKYAVASDEYPGQKELQNYNGAQTEVVNYYFKDLNNLNPQIKQAIKNIEDMLTKISADPKKQERGQITPTLSAEISGAPSKVEIAGLFPNQLDIQDFTIVPVNINNDKVFLIKGMGGDKTTTSYFIVYDNTAKKTLYQSDGQVYLNSNSQSADLQSNQEIKVTVNYYGYLLTEFIGYNETVKQYVPKNLQHHDEMVQTLAGINQKSSCQIVKNGPQMLIIDIKNQYGENQACLNGITVKEYLRIKTLLESILQGKDLSVID